MGYCPARTGRSWCAGGPGGPARGLNRTQPSKRGGLGMGYRRYGGAPDAGARARVAPRRASARLLVLLGGTLILAGCGTAAQQASTSSPSPVTTLPQAQSVGQAKKASRSFLLEVNDVCRTVRQGAPTSLRTPYTRTELITHARAARTATQRTVVSLQRLAAHGDGPALRAIASGYVGLQATYASTSAVARNAQSATRLGQAVQLREQSVSAAARSAGVPACGVAGL